VSSSGLLTITGAKWTTYRNMAQDAVDHALVLAHLDERPCVTKELRLHGWHENARELGELGVYGTDAPGLLRLAASDPALGAPLHPELPVTGAQIVWAARHEMARTLEDALARRTRALFLNASAALAMAPAAARLLASELGRDEDWQTAQIAEFRAVADTFFTQPQPTQKT
jgi:glycerol-3-phosphate dehydrogenase